MIKREIVDKKIMFRSKQRDKDGNVIEVAKAVRQNATIRHVVSPNTVNEMVSNTQDDSKSFGLVQGAKLN
jgi:hypothetical protein